MIRLLAFLLSVSPAFAQQPPTPKEQALGARIMFEVNASVECNANLITLQRENEALQARIKALEPKKDQP